MSEELGNRKKRLEEALILAVSRKCRGWGFKRRVAAKSLVRNHENGNLSVIEFQSTDRSDVAAVRVSAGVASARLGLALFPKRKLGAHDLHLARIIWPTKKDGNTAQIWDSWFVMKNDRDVETSAYEISRWLDEGGNDWMVGHSDDHRLIESLRFEGDRMAKIYADILDALVAGCEPDLSGWLSGSK